MAVYYEDVDYLFTEGSICSQLALAQPGEDVSGGYAAVLLDHLLPLLPEHCDGLVGQPGHLLRGGLDRVGPDQVSMPGDDGLCLVYLRAGVVDYAPRTGVCRPPASGRRPAWRRTGPSAPGLWPRSPARGGCLLRLPGRRIWLRPLPGGPWRYALGGSPAGVGRRAAAPRWRPGPPGGV